MDPGSLVLQFVHCEIILLSSSYAAYCMQDQTGAEYCRCLLLAHYSGLSGGHVQDVNSTGVTPIAYPGASTPGPPFHTPSYVNLYEEGLSFHCHQQARESAYAIPLQVPSWDYTSQVPATASDKVLCDSEENQDTGAYPANAPAKQWNVQVSWRYTFLLARSPELFLTPYLYRTGGPTTDVFPCELCATAMRRTLSAEERSCRNQCLTSVLRSSW